MSRKHLIIPDTQVKPGVRTDYLDWIGRYIVDKKPDVIVHIGDFADMPSLSSYDVGKKQFEGRRYRDDVQASIAGMERLFAPINDYNAKAKRNHEKRYTPTLVLTLGNHEQRIVRATEDDPKLDGTISISDLHYEDFGWQVYPYLEPVVIDGIAYCHYFVTGIMGRPVSSARQLLLKKHMSCTMGHVQQWDLATERRGDGGTITGLFAGCIYQHDEDYLSPQTNRVHKQIWMKYEVDDGFYYPHPISLEYLELKYGKESNGSEPVSS